MQKVKLHFRLVLLVIFIFPVIFQSLHLVSEHSAPSDQSESICCQHQDENSSDFGFSIQSDVDEDCLVCEYEISINKIEEIQTFSALFIEHSSQYNSSYLELHTTNSFNSFLKRGPPVLL